MITILSGRHAGQLFRHLRAYHEMSQRELGWRIQTDQRTISARESGHGGMLTDALIDTAAIFGFNLALIPQRHPGARPTGTGWPA